MDKQQFEVKTRVPAFQSNLVMKLEVGVDTLRGQWILTCMDRKWKSPFLAVEGKVDAQLFDDLWSSLNGYAVMRAWPDDVNSKTHDDWLLLCDDLNKQYTEAVRKYLEEANKKPAASVILPQGQVTPFESE